MKSRGSLARGCGAIKVGCVHVRRLAGSPSQMRRRRSNRGEGARPRSSVFMEVVHRDISFSAAGIGASLKYWCTVPPIRSRISLRLQVRDTNGRWVTMAQQEDRAVPVPSPKTMTATAACFAGVWRARGTAVGALRGADGHVKEFEPAQKDSRERLVSADDCARG